LAILLDTSVAIPLRDGEPEVWSRAMALETAPYISILTAAELEGGVYRDPALSAKRRAALDALDGKLDIIAFDATELAAYSAMLAAIGFKRANVLDRLIAATALANGLALATRNAKDFRDIPGLIIEEW
jgi:predicted nucleic acid-binding protein